MFYPQIHMEYAYHLHSVVLNTKSSEMLIVEPLEPDETILVIRLVLSKPKPIPPASSVAL